MRSLVAIVSMLFLCSFQPRKEKTIVLVISPTAHARLQYGAEKLAEALSLAGYKTTVTKKNTVPKDDAIIITNVQDPLFEITQKHQSNRPAGKEGFSISTIRENIFITGTDESGSLYGCLELAERVKKTGSLPGNIS